MVPSGLDIGTGSTSAPSSGAQDRSFSDPSGARTTTIAPGPEVGSPAALMASAVVVPAGTRTRSTTAEERDADTALLQGCDGGQVDITGWGRAPGDKADGVNILAPRPPE